MGFISEYTKAQLKHKFAHPVRTLLWALSPVVFFIVTIIIGKSMKRETEVTRVSFQSILMTAATLTFFIAYSYVIGYDVIREKQILRKQHMISNGLGLLKFYMAWLNVYNVFILPLSIIMVAVFYILGVFPHVNIFVQFIDFYIFQLTNVTVCFWISTYVPVACIGAFVVLFFNLSFLGAYFGMAYIPDNVKDTLCLFISPMTIGGILNNFQHAEISNDIITLKNLIPFLGGKYNVFAMTFKLILNNVLYVSFAMAFDKLFKHLNRNKSEIKKREFYENDAKTIEAAKTVKRGDAKISVENAYKTYFGKNKETKKTSEVDAIKNVSFEVYNNEVFGIAGKDGAGKSTLFKMITGRILSSYGNVEVMSNIGLDQAGMMAQLGSVSPQDDYVIIEEGSVANNIDLYNSIIKSNKSKEDPYELLNQLNFKGKKTDAYCKLDINERTKVKNVIALMADKKFIFFDEPTAGMTDSDKEAFWKVLESKKEGKTIVFTTSSVDEAEQHSDRVLVLDDGKVDCIGEVEVVKDNNKIAKQHELTVTVEN
ncbi:P-loop containing nucleoside triphosphate hydrolase protein [Anaeromyces robustus]|uniref:p-loop containing nucleoside triphosphate hydrolase protein n=1 Tax=Anaeromyces robustus TaxID=1754192 RepID=A0A1Y1X5P9_9FUNG|nr:P-loop containing nucleoside triphosphate hydrolase protein [Anaeromyces robustus]|eukprot:ORX80975.1 P-loop containing nucleoside triphosphate hydrolase protein [Anaeromyces robustus]